MVFARARKDNYMDWKDIEGKTIKKVEYYDSPCERTTVILNFSDGTKAVLTSYVTCEGEGSEIEIDSE
jgi:hypothetical protein